MDHSNMIYGFILAGGSGTRLWPLSRKELPKQFLAIGGEYTLFQNTLLRLCEFIPPAKIRIIAGDESSSLITYQAGSVGCGASMIIREPAGHNTAPAIALGIASALGDGASRDDIAIVCPSDHIIRDAKKFHSAVDTAVKAASAGKLVTFGVKPTAAETGFGYIKTGKTTETGIIEALGFIEKPDIETASQYLKSGNYYWNSGILCFRLGDMLDALSEYFPECGKPAAEGMAALLREFRDIPPISIDYAVMEKAKNIVCVPLDTDWSDFGSWDAVWQNFAKDEKNNAAIGDTVLQDVEDSLIFAQERLVAAAHVKDLIVVDTHDALYISKRGHSQKVRETVKEIQSSNRKETEQAAFNARPWGTYKILSETARDKVKRITVMPMKRLSLQYHEHRSEHWVVVKGTAKVTLHDAGNSEGKKEFILKEGESCFVPKGTMHRLENPLTEPVEIIEIQTGTRLDENDIIRMDDDFERI